MEQARLIIAIVLSVAVFFLYGIFFGEKDTVAPVIEQATTPEAATAQAPLPLQPDQTAVPQIPLTGTVNQNPAYIPKDITVNTPKYSVSISEAGANFVSFTLANYREEVSKNSPQKELVLENENGMPGVGFVKNSIPDMERAIFKTDSDSDIIDILSDSGSVRFIWTSPQGIKITKRYTFSADTYAIGLDVVVENASAYSIQDSLTLSLVKSYPDGGKSRYGFEGPSMMLNNELEEVKIKKIEENNSFTGVLDWVAVQDRYFMSSIIPDNPKAATARLYLSETSVLTTQYVQPESVIVPGTSQAFSYKLFLGPKSMDVLKSIGLGFDKAINFGMFDLLAKPCVWLMNKLYSVIPNYGLAIIILTLMIKGVLWPLGTKSYKSMAEMKKIQPLMAELREKYKDDKRKMNEETMKLYKLYKVNPMGGCLPMILQIPVFFALYRMLYQAIELRHAPFFGWINDLSAPDRLFSFGFSVPFMEPPYGIPVLTIIMGATMLLQQKMSPPMGDPTQAKMMMLMPVVFTVIFINFSSGLVLYWLVNNVVSISQQYYISKKAS
ncbi:MAG: membrane protein insertase YidC [Desulfobacterales bacterium]|nr:membrane protein insertase YidC [Desulfobacterales bacterium]